MSTNDLCAIINKCECAVSVYVNEHRNYYQTVDQYITYQGLEVGEDIKKKMIELNTIVEFCFFPKTPVGSYQMVHYSLDECIKEALEILGINSQTN